MQLKVQRLEGADLVSCVVLTAIALLGPTLQADDELDLHLAEMRQRLDDRARPLGDRARLGAEMAATLDRAAQAASAVELRQERWAQAAALLDRFNDRNPGHPRAGEFALQATVYLWARALAWSQRAEFVPTDQKARKRAAAALDAVVDRLRGLAEADGAVGQHARYRLARAIKDRASVEPDAKAQRRAAAEALSVLEGGKFTDELHGHVDLLRGELLVALGRAEEALEAMSSAEKARPAPPAQEVIAVKASALAGMARYAQALDAIEATTVPGPRKELEAVRVRIAQCRAATTPAERGRAESDAFERVERLRAADASEATLALIEVARGLGEPSTGQAASAWARVAEGHLILGDAKTSTRLLLAGATKAIERRDFDAAFRMRYRAGAISLEAGDLRTAEQVLAGVTGDQRAGPIRARASLLRLLALKRRQSAEPAGANRDLLVQAIHQHLREFASDSTAGEARWMLGEALTALGDNEGAIVAWTGVPRDDGRWLESRLSVVELARRDIEAAVAAGEPEAARAQVGAVRRVLTRLRSEAAESSERTEIDLAGARLELIPRAAEAGRARLILDETSRGALGAETRQRVEVLRVASAIVDGRYAEAESAARTLARTAPSFALLDLARWLDLAASTTESDLVRRRCGQTLTTVLAAVDAAKPTAEAYAIESALLRVRGQAFRGDVAAARAALQRQQIDTATLPAALLFKLADTASRAGETGQAIAAYRAAGQRSPAGSHAWLEARFGLATACESAGRIDQARQIIEAAAVLHPELGGGELRAKFERLRARLGR
jgi:outer membrane protein assembly factor BamD (BamD/ComL family)